MPDCNQLLPSLLSIIITKHQLSIYTTHCPECVCVCGGGWRYHTFLSQRRGRNVHMDNLDTKTYAQWCLLGNALLIPVFSSSSSDVSHRVCWCFRCVFGPKTYTAHAPTQWCFVVTGEASNFWQWACSGDRVIYLLGFLYLLLASSSFMQKNRKFNSNLSGTIKTDRYLKLSLMRFNVFLLHCLSNKHLTKKIKL